MKNKKTFLLDLGIYKKLAPSDSILFLIISLLLLIQFFFVLNELNKLILVETPIKYGTLSEGIVGVPVIYNPLYPTNNAEEDISALIHAGLLQYHKGELRPQLAEYIKLESDETYIVQIKEGAKFHNGKSVGLQDILNTILMTQGDEKNIYYNAWENVKIEKKSNTQLQFTIPKDNTHFPEAFTMPILPYHIWKKIPLENIKVYKGPGFRIGAGPYKFEKEETTLDEKPTKLILKAFPEYIFGEPYIQTLEVNFFENSKELLDSYAIGAIDSLHSAAAAEIPALIAQKEYTYSVYTGETDRLFGLFYNTGDDRILQDSFLRSVLSESIEREDIVREVFKDFALPIQSPIASDKKLEKKSSTIKIIEKSLGDTGWKFNSTIGKRTKEGQSLSVSFIYPDIEEAQQISSLINLQWAKLGVDVISHALPQDVFANMIQEGSFDIALLGYEAKLPKDLPDIWKSGEIKNISTITNFATPKLNSLLSELETTKIPSRLLDKMPINKQKNDKWQNTVYNEIKIEIAKNVPTTFLYSPKFLLVLSNEIQGVTKEGKDLGHISKSKERFSNIHEWYIQKEKIWKFLIKQK